MKNNWNFFYDVNSGYVSSYKLYKKLKEEGHTDIKFDDIQKFYDNQEAVQKTKSIFKKTV